MLHSPTVPYFHHVPRGWREGTAGWPTRGCGQHPINAAGGLGEADWCPGLQECDPGQGGSERQGSMRTGR